MLFSIDTIRNATEKSSDKNDILTENNSSCFLEQALCMIQNDTNEFNSFIAGVSSTSSSAPVYANIVFNFVFEKFNRNIYILSNSFKNALNDLITSDCRDIIKYKDKILNYDKSIYLDKPYYDFYNLNVLESYKTSYKTEIENILKRFYTTIEFISNYDNLSKNDKVVFLNRMKELENTINSDIELLRGKVLGLDYEVTNDKFMSLLFSFFRTTIEPIDNPVIAVSRIQEACKSFYNYNEIINTDRDIFKLNSMNYIVSQDINKYVYNDQTVQLYNYIVINYCTRIKNITDLYTIMLSAKMDALFDYSTINKFILLKVCDNIKKEEGK